MSQILVFIMFFTISQTVNECYSAACTEVRVSHNCIIVE